MQSLARCDGQLAANTCTGSDPPCARPIVPDANPDLQRLCFDRALEPTCKDRGPRNEREASARRTDNDLFELVGKGRVRVTECPLHFVDQLFEHSAENRSGVTPLSRLLAFLCEDYELLGDGLQPHEVLYVAPG